MTQALSLCELKEQTSHPSICPVSVMYDIEFSDQLKIKQTN